MIWNVCRLGALMMVLGGCSLVVMRGADSKRDRPAEPVCSESLVPIYVDGFTASFTAGMAAELAQLELEPPVPESVLAGFVITSLLFTVSAVSGASMYKSCRRAKADWYASEAIRESGVGKPDAASGYFCTSSPSRAELHPCARERAACEQLRAAIALPDRQACAPRDRAWCFDVNATTRCFGTQYACEEQAAAAAAPQACIQRL